MPKDEFDFEDPFELNGMAFLSHEDTTNDMAECFTEEYLRMGYNHQQVLALFRNPHYLGPNMAFEKRGELFIRNLIADVFARWGKAVTWPESSRAGSPLPAANVELTAIEPQRRPRRDAPHLESRGEGQGEGAHHSSCGHGCGCSSAAPAEQTVSHDETLADPMGSPIPKLNV
jgi:hypothetical protein